MKTLLKLATLGALTAIAVNIYRRQQRWDRELPGNRIKRRGMNQGTDQVADTNTVSSGDAEQDQRGPQPQDWRGAQNVLE